MEGPAIAGRRLTSQDAGLPHVLLGRLRCGGEHLVLDALTGTERPA